MKKSTAIWMAIACFFMGSALGFLCAPIKQGVSVRVCNNGNEPQFARQALEDDDLDEDELAF